MDFKPFLKIIYGLAFGMVFWVAPAIVHAGGLYFSGLANSYAVGETVAVNVNISSSDQSTNAVSGVVNFPSNMLQVASLSKNGSVCSFWVQELSFSNANGTVSFECVVLNPGFTGSVGKVLGISFKAKNVGNAFLNFSSASMLANDGNGTDILKETGTASFSITAATADTVPVPPVSTGVSAVSLKIQSPNHPDSSKWYAKNKAKFNWQLPAGATAVRLLFDKAATTVPTINYVPPISSKEITDIEDGIYYFHARVQTAAGWGESTHFKFQIDTKAPEFFTIEEIERQDPAYPKAKLTFSAKDALSGIDHYQIRIDNGQIQRWEDDGSHVFQTSALDPGSHTLSIKAMDKAGNFLEDSVQVVVAPLSPVIVTKYPAQLQFGESLIVETQGEANTRVILYLQTGQAPAAQYTAQSDAKGLTVFIIHDDLKEGTHQGWAVAVDGREAKSNPSAKFTTSIEHPALKKFSLLATNVLAVLVPLLALLFALVFLVFWLWHKLGRFVRNLRKETKEAENALHQAFTLLNKNMRRQAAMLEKAKKNRALTKEEAKILKKFKQDLQEAEKSIAKEIRDIQKTK